MTGQCRWLGIEPTLAALAGSRWSEWPPHQRAAVLDVLDAFWSRTLGTHPGPYDVGDVLCGFGMLVPDVAALIGRWHLADGAAAQHLRDLVIAKGHLAGPYRAPPYWSPDSAAVVLDWLRSPALVDAVTAAAAATTDPAVLDALDETDRYLAAMR
ncbi:hypothetical protein [Pseudonocardia sp. GCM10023141]|uniref:hypothetical protein n=1 Tax=Pseudonocardia sp. GCM10023141 TaxID=3252653 RepID=UPI003621FA28